MFLIREIRDIRGLGGGPGVWTTCMLFFQLVLLAGYAYAHGLNRWLAPRAQGVTHLVLLAVALAMLPITPLEAWKPHGSGDPRLQILHEEQPQKWWLLSSAWMLLSRDPEVFNVPFIEGASRLAQSDPDNVPLWTDDFTTILPIIH